MKNYLLTGFLSACMILSSDNLSAQAMQHAISATPKTLYDQAYGKDDRQTMDIYFPETVDDSTKLMVIVHGGAWVRGDKSEFSPYVSALRTLLPGYAFANINYRLYRQGKNPFPTQEQDMKAAIRYLIEKTPEWGLSGKYVLLGASAGAHLALLQGYKVKSGNPPAAIISFFGPTDLEEMYQSSSNDDVKPLLQSLLGSEPEKNPDLYRNSSPARFVSESSPPTLILQGGRDRLVDQSQAVLLAKKLEDAGVPYELKVYPEEGHGWRGPLLIESFTRVSAFLKKHVP